MSGYGRTGEQLPIFFFFLPVATPVAVMPQLVPSPTSPLVDAIHLTPEVDERLRHIQSNGHLP